MDPFAQSREDDDLFADEFEPIPEPTTTVDGAPSSLTSNSGPAEAPESDITHPLANSTANPTSSTSDAPPAGPSNNSNYRQPRRNDQDRRQRGGRGGGRGGVQNGGLNASRYAQVEPTPTSTSAPSTAAQAQPSSQTVQTTSTTTTANPDSMDTQPTQSEPNVQSNAQEPQQPTQPTRTPAVRGDRSATGGPAHKKLTEEELTAKMEKMAIINAQKAERHRLSEADQAAFQHREKELAKERREKAISEKKNERVMEMERAKNRERKMRAQGGREWDSEKVESDIVDRKGRSSEYVKGGHGGVIRGGLAGSRYSSNVDDEDVESPKRSGTFEMKGRGGRGGRGGARGGKVKAPSAPVAEDFPPLAPVSNVPAASGDWADEMATPVEEKKLEA